MHCIRTFAFRIGTNRVPLNRLVLLQMGSGLFSPLSVEFLLRGAKVGGSAGWRLVHREIWIQKQEGTFVG